MNHIGTVAAIFAIAIMTITAIKAIERAAYDAVHFEEVGQ